MTKPLVLYFTDFPASQDKLEKLKDAVELLKVRRDVFLDESSFNRIVHLQNTWGLLPTIIDSVDNRVLEKLPHLKIIANYGAGVNNIDLAVAKTLQIAVSNTPDVLSESVADLTWGLILSAARRIVASDHIVRSGQFPGWSPYYELGQDVHHKTLGLIGFGSIASAVAKRAQGFSMNLVYYKRTPLPPEIEKMYGLTFCSLDSLLQNSDIVSLHAPLTPETYHLINAQRLSLMKPTAILVNTSRGPIIDEEALVRALQKKVISAAALDVFEHEPTLHPELCSCENVTLTAHIGSATIETREEMGDLAIQNILSFLETGKMVTPVSR
ncbi:MAG: D-glycerate dehydrogenase [Cyanobacteria bacterium]|nr:D-glycerate dehydrogenase [Cyanobacteriota bacterium]